MTDLTVVVLIKTLVKTIRYEASWFVFKRGRDPRAPGSVYRDGPVLRHNPNWNKYRHEQPTTRQEHMFRDFWRNWRDQPGQGGPREDKTGPHDPLPDWRDDHSGTGGGSCDYPDWNSPDPVPDHIRKEFLRQNPGFQGF
ncbi:MAG: hypothetical protein GY931_16580 [Maribacter sp.]|nr:hypothetical protein [Maribacter sp.]